MATIQTNTAAQLYSLICEDWCSLNPAARARLKVCELPLAQWLFESRRQRNKALMVGVNGPQGCGKSTTVASLKCLLEQYYGLRVAVVSIDDFYLTRAARQTLGKTVHPLLVTRGVPGTHDVDLAIKTLTRLQSDQGTGELAIPSFNKAVDDRAPVKDWPVVATPVDVILFDGWCVGAVAESEDALITPVNELECNEDTDAHWRRYVNLSLATGYRELFDLLDALIVFSCGDFSWVYDWRKEQEQDNARRAKASGSALSGIMNDTELKRFVLHYERITRHCQKVLPAMADVVVPLSKSREVSVLRWRQNQ